MLREGVCVWLSACTCVRAHLIRRDPTHAVAIAARVVAHGSAARAVQILPLQAGEQHVASHESHASTSLLFTLSSALGRKKMCEPASLLELSEQAFLRRFESAERRRQFALTDAHRNGGPRLTDPLTASLTNPGRDAGRAPCAVPRRLRVRHVLDRHPFSPACREREQGP